MTAVGSPDSMAALIRSARLAAGPSTARQTLRGSPDRLICLGHAGPTEIGQTTSVSRHPADAKRAVSVLPTPISWPKYPYLRAESHAAAAPWWGHGSILGAMSVYPYFCYVIRNYTERLASCKPVFSTS